MYIPVCLINNHLASIYSVMAKDENKAKFLTSEDLQYLAALISKYYGKDKSEYATNFSLKRGRCMPSTPRFCALPYRIEKEKFGENFVYSQEYIAKYRRLYESCIERFGQIGKHDKETDEARIQLSYKLSSLKDQELSGADFVADGLYEASCADIADDIKHRDFFAPSYTSRARVAIQDRKLSDVEKTQWVNSQFYIMKNVSSGNKEVLLDGLLNLYEEYFNSGLPYIFYYQQTRLNPSIDLKLKFDEKEKQKFKKALELAIEEFSNTARPQINNATYEELSEMTNHVNANLRQ